IDELYISSLCHVLVYLFFLYVTATTVFYSLSLHDALPICRSGSSPAVRSARVLCPHPAASAPAGCRTGSPSAPCSSGIPPAQKRSEEHTSELQSLAYLVCRLLLEKKKYKHITIYLITQLLQ